VAAAAYLEANLRAAGRPVASQAFEAAGVAVRNLELAEEDGQHQGGEAQRKHEPGYAVDTQRQLLLVL
jgi:hypothetical protein